jgi:hypothetical protein
MVGRSLNHKRKAMQRSNPLLDATIRDFSGGWNVVDNDLNLNTKYSKILENTHRGVDGANVIRPGTRLFAETSEHLDKIINCEYFNGYIIAVGSNGQMVSINSVGSVRSIWSDDWANNLAGSPNGWDTTPSASFALFNGDLIVCNGVNKPVIINSSMEASYLKDLADDSNANTPIARFVMTQGRYLVMSGSLTAGQEDVIYISATDISGTWVGDSAPNDAVNLSLGSRVTSGSSTIKGLGHFRGQLMVMFEEVILPGTLGVFVSTAHVPTFTDAISEIGAMSNRSIQTVGEDMLVADFNGISSIKKALITGSVTSVRNSQLIDPEYHRTIDGLDSTITLEDKVWSLWDSTSNNYMIFMPNGVNDTEITEYRCFVYKKNKALSLDAWADWRGWKFTSGCRTALKNIFLAEGTQIYILGETDNTKHEIYKDYEGDQEMWGDDTTFTDGLGWTPVADVDDSGIPISFKWELPWSDNKDRFAVKESRYINFDTEGDNRFTVDMFVDNIYEDRTHFGEDWEEDELKFDDGTGWDVEALDPTLSMTFEGGDAPGFGADEFGDDFGGGRPTRLEKLYAWPSKYKLSKLRITGDGTKKLKFVSITMAYLKGGPRR